MGAFKRIKDLSKYVTNSGFSGNPSAGIFWNDITFGKISNIT